MAEKGRVWMDAETKLLLEIWSQDTIQRQLKGALRNVNVFAQVVEELQKCAVIITQWNNVESR